MAYWVEDEEEVREREAEEARRGCGRVARAASLEDAEGRRIEECLAAALGTRPAGAAAEVVLRLGPGPQERFWATRVRFGGAVEILSWPESEPEAVRLEWVYPPGTGLEDRSAALSRTASLYWASDRKDEALRCWLEGALEGFGGEAEAC